MNSCPRWRGVLSGAVLFVQFAGSAAAQHVLFAQYNGEYHPVVRVRGLQACVSVKDKILIADGRSFALQKVEEFLPAFVSVRNIDVQTSYLDVNGSAINNDFHFRASLESPYELEDVFIVLDLDMDAAGKMIFVQEVGKLEPRQPKLVAITVPLASKLGAGRYQFHLFSRGMEVLQSEIPALACDLAVDRMIAKRLPSGPDAAPRLFIGPEPEYPKQFKKSRTKGDAVVKVRIGANGRVFDPEVKRASDPAFGAEALKAVRLWRFIPRMKDGRPVETNAEIPIDFTPPEPSKGKS